MTVNKNGDDFPIEKIREALSGYLGTVKYSTTIQSVRDQVLSALPMNFSGSVDVSQDAHDPTKVNVMMSVPLTYVQVTYIAEPSGDHRYVGGCWLSDDPSRVRSCAGSRVGPTNHTVSVGFRACLRGRMLR
jgi:hypothetical protein